MANPQNLRKLTTTQAREIGKLGGKASAEAKKKRKTFKELLNMFGELDIKDVEARKKLEEYGISKGLLTHDTAVIIGQYIKAEKGDTQAATFIRDTKGESPKDAALSLNIENATGIEITFKDFGGSDGSTSNSATQNA